MSRILVVEDEEGLSGAMKEWLEDECYVVSVIDDGLVALELLKSASFELIVLDLMLPGLSGIEVCKQYRKAGGKAPILMLTAKSTMACKEEGLDSGADDYLTKPCNLRELSARVRALLRRPLSSPVIVLEAGDIQLDTNSRTVTKAGSPLKLLPKEFILLEVLLKHKGQVLSTEALIEHVWGTNSTIAPETVRSHLKALRKKVDGKAADSLISTVHGMGYKIEA
ncbi:MAG: DNA-binding response regulator [Cyanobacteria bacterium PR.3.49]|nr:DNA-binding response regulator [Cyanobacteria bacterium PR.3.49]